MQKHLQVQVLPLFCNCLYTNQFSKTFYQIGDEREKISLLLASLCALFLVACSNQKQADGKLNIVTTFYPVYEFTKQVAGDTANVELLIGAGTEPHEYEPSAKAVAKIQDADTFVYENENMETWVPKLLDTLDKKK